MIQLAQEKLKKMLKTSMDLDTNVNPSWLQMQIVEVLDEIKQGIKCPEMKREDTLLFEGHVYLVKREDGVDNGTISAYLERIS